MTVLNRVVNGISSTLGNDISHALSHSRHTHTHTVYVVIILAAQKTRMKEKKEGEP